MTKWLIYISVCLGFLNTLCGQNKGLIQQQYEIIDGDEYLAIKNYVTALEIYKEISKSIPDNRELQYKMALCYLNTNTNRLEAIKHLEYVVKVEKFVPEAWFELGYVYALAYKLDEAIASLEKYKTLVPKQSAKANVRIQQCKNAKELMKHPVNVSFHNLGKELNSAYPDYYPWITKDEIFLAFTSRRKGNIGGSVEGDGYYSSDIYTSNAVNGKWSKAKNIGPAINTALDEQVVGLKADGSEMLVYLDHYDNYGNLYSSKRKGNLFQKITPLTEQINKKIEHSGSISLEGNTIFFVRKDKENEENKTDIYMSRMLPSGAWGEPQKLNDNVNTPYNEDFPYLAIDGKTLYFSSEGHNSMGGFDLFKSTWNPETNNWSKAINLGYPVNTTDDDRSISLSADNSIGYISAVRPGGYGDLDIYRIKFNANKKYVIYKGDITFNDSTKTPKEIIATITTVEKTTNEEYSFAPNPQTGSFIMALPEGTYNITVNSSDYKSVTETLIVYDVGSATERKKEFKLVKP
jgi:tetratricopeptide (TPR) repeat protein